MIQINPAHIGPEGLPLQGEEDAAFLDLDSFPEKLSAATPLKYDLYCSMAGADLLVTGSLKVTVEGACSLCLKESKKEIKAPSVCIHVENVPQDGPYDLTGEIREEILLAFPLRFQCKEKCKGICTGCGADLNEEKCSCSKKKKKQEEKVDKDSPWNALDALKL